MVHSSVSISPCEFINVTPVNPLISKCQIKVCYVGEQPNRNRSVITKEVARQMANSLPGSPIVGYFNTEKGDFEEHNRQIDISNGEIKFTDTTKPYGFVDLNAKCWFQTFLDDGQNEHEYLMTEGYLWTEQYPECKRVIENGNNQSMELDEKSLKASWTFDNNGDYEFFIINEAIISKLCILGDECEPCFEGSRITKVQFSFEEDFKQKMFSMMEELKDLLNKGGTPVFTTYSVTVGDALWTALYSHIEENYQDYSIDGIYEDEGQKYAILKNPEGQFSRLDFSFDEENVLQASEQLTEMDASYVEAVQFSAEDVELFVSNFKKKDENEDKDDKEETAENEDKAEGEDSSEKDSEDAADEKPEEKKEESDEDEDKKKKAKYDLEDVVEYHELVAEHDKLVSEYAELENAFNSLKESAEALTAEIEPLRKFRAEVEKGQKEEMINSFFMLSDEDKADVIENIDTYSLEEIEAKLSVICFRNKVSFSEEEEHRENPMTYSLDSFTNGGTSVPAWVKKVAEVAKESN